MRVRAIAAVAAIIGWSGLALQLIIIVGNMGVGAGLWRFFGFFTILTNILAAAVASGIALGSRRLSGPRPTLAAASSIVVVGIVYAVALSGTWRPTGAQKVADVLLHYAAPGLWALLWLAMPRMPVGWRDVAWALTFPALYLVYALARGAADGWYAYWFLNPAEQSASALALSIAVLMATFAVTASLLTSIKRTR